MRKADFYERFLQRTKIITKIHETTSQFLDDRSRKQFQTTVNTLLHDSGTEISKSLSVINIQRTVQQDFLQESSRLKEEDFLWESFGFRLELESCGAVKIIQLPYDSKMFSSIKTNYMPLLNKRHSKEYETKINIELVRVFKLSITDNKAPVISAVESRKPKRIGKTIRTISMISELLANLQVNNNQTTKKAWQTPPQSANNSRRLASSSSSSTSTLSKKRNDVIHFSETNSFSNETLSALNNSFGNGNSITELARFAENSLSDENEVELETETEEQNQKSEQVNSECHCNDSFLWKTILEKIENDCGENWFLSPRNFPETTKLIPLFLPNVLINNSTIHWMRPQWKNRLVSGSLFVIQGNGNICLESFHVVSSSSNNEPFLIPIIPQHQNRLPAIQNLENINLIPATVKNLFYCKQTQEILKSTTTISEKEQQKLLELYSKPNPSETIDFIYALETDGINKWITTLSKLEILELIGSYLIRLPRLPSSSLIFPDIYSISKHGNNSPTLKHYYCLLFPSTQFVNVRPEFLIQYDIHEEISANSQQQQNKQNQHFLFRNCCWNGCQSSAMIAPLDCHPNLHFCYLHSTILLKSPHEIESLPQISERDVETALVNPGIISKAFPFVAQLLKGHLIEQAIRRIARKETNRVLISESNRNPKNETLRLKSEIAALEETLEQIKTQNRGSSASSNH